ncbi:MAG: hypothetical protein ACRDZ1_04415 [Acidimicrobiia bacterium]
MARRDYQREYAARSARARAAGFASFHEQRRTFDGPPASRSALERLPERAAGKYQDALGVVRDVRAGYTPESAARFHGISLDAVRTFTGDALDRDADRLARSILVMGRDGPTEVVVRGSRAASTAAAHASALEHYVRTGDGSRLREFRGRRVGGVRLVDDPRVLRRLAREGALTFEELYVLVVAA